MKRGLQQLLRRWTLQQGKIGPCHSPKFLRDMRHFCRQRAFPPQWRLKSDLLQAGIVSPKTVATCTTKGLKALPNLLSCQPVPHAHQKQFASRSARLTVQIMITNVALIVILALASSVSAQSNSTSPLVEYFSNTNSSTYSYFWTALQAAHLDDYLADNTLTLTIFAPTNDAWVKRLPTLTRANGITVADLFSESKSAALQNMLQYHILNKAQGASSFNNGDYLGTLANLCSDAKTLQISVANNGAITLLAAGGSRPKLLDRGIVVGSSGRQSIIFAIDDVLLPSVVTTPLSVALSSGNGSSNVYSPAINNKQNVISDLQSKTQDEALAPVYLAPQTPPLAAPASNSTRTPSASG